MADDLTGKVCVACEKPAEGVCVNCGAFVCFDHDFGDSDEDMECSDEIACEERMIRRNKEMADDE